VAVQVRDTGIGIPEAQQERIFREFEQGDGGPSRQYGGTGLGLTISQRIIERMGGSIAVESTPGAGSTFSFTVPLPAAAESAAFTPPNLAGKAMMIVTTGAIEGALLARRLGRWGASTCAITDETIAATMLPERSWEVLLLDHAFGDDKVRSLLDAARNHVHRRIILIAPAARHELPALQEAGVTGYLIKPVRAASLAARLAPSSLPAAADAEELREGFAAPLPGKGLSILVAEDNDINALLARALLAKLGHRPTVASNGAAAIESWQAAQGAGTPYDVVLMDVHMPGLDGFEATRRLRAAEAERGSGRTRIIALTANASAEDRDACLAAGMDGFVTKPLDRDKLAEVLAGATAAQAA
jgi:CheY-like chemotaxis protein